MEENKATDSLLGVVGETNLKAVSDSFINTMLSQLVELQQSTIAARRQQEDAWQTRMAMVSELNSANTSHHRNVNAATTGQLLGTGIMGLKELDKSAEENVAAGISAAVGAKTADANITTTLSAMAAAMEQINSRLASLENKGSN